MAHHQQMQFVTLVDRHFVRAQRPGLRILDVGAYDLNGSARSVFPDCDYLGADLCAGPGVDLVCSGHEIALPDGSFDIALSCECFEHNAHWKETFRNMHRMTRAGGLVVMTCAAPGRLEHGTPRTDVASSPGTRALGVSYYRNLTERDFTDAFALDEMFSRWRFFDDRRSHDLYFVGWKSGHTRFVGDFDDFVRAVARIEAPAPMPLMLVDVPVRMARWLPIDDRRFQDFVVGYRRRGRSMRALIMRLLPGGR